MSDWEPLDSKARHRALDPNASFVVQAPAGSGKTGLLIQRTLALLTRVRQPEEVVAITFTRKAAAEMRERLLEALAAADGPEPEAAYEKITWALARALLAHDAAHEWNLTLNPSRLRIMTIDAFCASLVSQMPVLSRFGASHEVLQNAAPLYRRAARRLFGSLEEDSALGGSLGVLLKHLDNYQERVEDLLVDMLAHRDRWLPLVTGSERPDLTREALEDTLRLCVEQALGHVHETLPGDAVDGLIDVLRHSAGLLEDDHPLSACRGLDAIPDARAEHRELWTAIAGFLLTDKGQVRKQLTAKQGVLAPSSARDKDEKALRTERKQHAQALLDRVREAPEFCAALRELDGLPPIHYDKDDWQILEVLQPVLPMAAAELKVLFQERGQIDFTEQAHRALMALGTDTEPTDLALALDYRIGHLLVDEFQDTSRTQFEMLERLVSGWSPDDGRTLFVVGDPMQSIYRFRDAEVGLFLQAQQHGVGDVKLEALTLSANFRTRRNLVQRCNDVFAQLFPDLGDATEGTVPFSAAEGVRAEGGGGLVCHTFTDEADQQAEHVVAQVHSALSADRNASVAILVRSRTHLRDILPRLTAAGIAFHAVDILPLATSPVVIDLWSLTRAMLHLGDRTAWLALLRAPWCGLMLEDLHALAGGQARFTVWELIINDDRRAPLSADGKVRLARIKAVLAQALGARGRRDLRRWVEGTWTALGGPACLTSPTEINNALTYFDLLESLDQSGGLENLDDLTRGVERLYADATSDPDARLQIMTIHKAKGLEFDTVIVPGLERRTPPNRRALLQWIEFGDQDGVARRLLAPIEAAGNAGDIGRYVGRIQSARDRAEALRLLYVAATRARESLHLMLTLGATDEGELKPPSAGALGGMLWPALEASFAAGRVADRAPAQEAQDDDATDVHRLRRVPSQWLLPRAPQPKPWVGSETVLPVDTQREADWAGDSARHVGTTVHRILQQMAEEGIDPWMARWMDILDAYATRMLANLGVRNDELPGASERVTRAIRRCLEDERGRWLLSAHVKDRTEMPMSAWVDGRVRNVVLDRTFMDVEGTRWIVDYKTSQHDVGSDEAFMDAQLEVYRSQLELYARVMQRFESAPIKLALYFPLLPGWREWQFRG